MERKNEEEIKKGVRIEGMEVEREIKEEGRIEDRK